MKPKREGEYLIDSVRGESLDIRTLKMVVAKYVMKVEEMRGRVTDPSLQNTLFCPCKNNGITYHMTTTRKSIELIFFLTQVVYNNPIDMKFVMMRPGYETSKSV